MPLDMSLDSHFKPANLQLDQKKRLDSAKKSSYEVAEIDPIDSLEFSGVDDYETARVFTLGNYELLFNPVADRTLDLVKCTCPDMTMKSKRAYLCKHACYLLKFHLSIPDAVLEQGAVDHEWLEEFI